MTIPYTLITPWRKSVRSESQDCVEVALAEIGTADEFPVEHRGEPRMERSADQG